MVRSKLYLTERVIRLDSDFTILEASILDIQEAFAKNQINSEELILKYMERIASLDQDGPRINSILELNPDAIQTARALDYERSINGIRSRLHGIPILVKDNIDTGDKMHTSAGSLALKDAYAKKDAFLIKKLRKAGALIFGKTNMTEWANYMSDQMPSGYSSRGGQVLNPYGLAALDPGGSSSGSGGAVTCNFCCAAIGTETSGSIIEPSGNHSIVGIKPTVGLVSRRGIIPASHMQDTAGPMARTVEDAVLLLGIMAGCDKEDPITITGQDKTCSDYTRFLDRKGLKGTKLGVPRDYFFDDLSEEEINLMENALRIMKQNGAEITDPILIPHVRELQSKVPNLYEFKKDINYYLSGLDSHIPVHSLTDLIRFHETDPEVMLKYGQAFFEKAESTKGSLAEPEYVSLRTKDMTLSREVIDRTIYKYKLDALVFPGDKAAGLVNKAGYPLITVPGGIQKNGKCMGITFTAEAFSEPKLIKLAYAFEQNTKYRVPPFNGR